MRSLLLYLFLLQSVRVCFAQDSGKLDSLIDLYTKGSRDYAKMPLMAIYAKEQKKNLVADSIANEYLNNYLPTLRSDAILKREVIELIKWFNRTSKTPAFRFFYTNADKVDKIMDDDFYSRHYIDYIIAIEEIEPYLFFNDNQISRNPDWEKMKLAISQKYNKEYASRTILDAKIRWSRARGDTVSIINFILEKMDKGQIDTTGFGKIELNNTIWNFIFARVEDQKILAKVTKYMEILINSDPKDPAYPYFLDTYANMLYKTGKKRKALIWEKRAMILKPEQEGLQETYAKMKKGERTWPCNDDNVERNHLKKIPGSVHFANTCPNK